MLLKLPDNALTAAPFVLTSQLFIVFASDTCIVSCFRALKGFFVALYKFLVCFCSKMITMCLIKSEKCKYYNIKIIFQAGECSYLA